LVFYYVTAVVRKGLLSFTFILYLFILLLNCWMFTGSRLLLPIKNELRYKDQ